MNKYDLPLTCQSCHKVDKCGILTTKKDSTEYYNILALEQFNKYLTASQDATKEVVGRTVSVRAAISAKLAPLQAALDPSSLNELTNFVLMLGYMFGQGQAELEYWPKVSETVDGKRIINDYKISKILSSMKPLTDD